MKSFIKTILTLFFSVLRDKVKKNNVIIFSGTDNYSYNGNSRYLYEHLSREHKYDVYWYTKSNQVKNHLALNKFKFLSLSNPFKLIITALRAKIVINDGDSYFNIFKICDSKDTYKISLFHGYGPKTTIAAKDDDNTRALRINRINKFDFINYTSPYLANNISKTIFGIPSHKAKILGFPKNDNFFNKDVINKKIYDKSFCKDLFANFTRDSKVILYTPTWRPYKYNLPLLDLSGFNVDDFDNFLNKNNLFFVYSVHSVRKPSELLGNTDRIKLINKSYPLYDTNEMMLESDILLNDYATTSVEFSILDRPQVFCMPDYDKYCKRKGFIEDYKNTIPGKAAESYDSLMKIFKEILGNSENYTLSFNNQRKNLLEKYYNLENYNSIDNCSKFLSNIINGDVSK